jgi:multiple sugar transport system ATP-binding protein
MAEIELINIWKHFGYKQTSQKYLYPLKDLLGADEGINKRKDGPFSIENLNLNIPDGKTTVILGPNGCGKTTLLRIIAGLEEQDSGEVKYDGVDMVDTLPKDRRIGIVFQNYALYPHFTSKQNILSYFLFKEKSPELDELANGKFAKTSELMGVDIAYLLDKKPIHLSGGEKQRVAIGRCITREPVLFLLDEPFSNLDPKLREKYRINLKRLLKHFHITTVYVTHDQQEAFILGDFIAVMNIGKIEQVGTYEYIYNNPKNIFVAEFLNIDAETPAINLIDGGYISEDLEGTIVGVRSENIEVYKENRLKHIKGNIIDINNVPLKNSTILEVKVGKNEIYTKLPLREDLSINDEVWLYFKEYHIFDKSSGVRLRSYP